MKNLTTVSLLFLLLSSCTIPISISTHSFEHYGTDALRYDADFFYVKSSLTGSSTATYNYKNGLVGGGHVRSGLIADAKEKMFKKHPLQPNQAYINMSIDVVHTQNGKVLGETQVIEQTVVTVVVSADVIQYGAASSANGSVSNTGVLNNSNNLEFSNNSKNIEPPSFNIGDTVYYEGQSAVIIKKSDSQSNRVKIQYKTSGGDLKSKWVYTNSFD